MPQPLDPRFPGPTQEIWAALSYEVTWLHGRWVIYRQLFGTNKGRVDLLNESAGTVTWMLQNILLHDVQLGLSKIGDPAGAGDRKNLTLRRLQLALRDAGEIEVANSLEPLLLTFEAACEKLRHRRNKWIAHYDLVTKLSEREEPLTGPSRDEIEGALLALRAVMNCAQLPYTDSQTAYEHIILNQDGEHLVTALAKAKRYGELIQDGTLPRDDFRRRFPNGI